MNESNIFGISVRGIISFLVVVALCWVCVYNSNDIKVGILKDITIMILSYYFGQKSQQVQNNKDIQSDNKPQS